MFVLAGKAGPHGNIEGTFMEPYDRDTLRADDDYNIVTVLTMLDNDDITIDDIRDVTVVIDRYTEMLRSAGRDY
jgi:hypothetical protein